jgi:hypothetical protein
MVELHKWRTRILLKDHGLDQCMSDLEKLSAEIQAVEELIWNSEDSDIESINLRIRTLD